MNMQSEKNALSHLYPPTHIWLGRNQMFGLKCVNSKSIKLTCYYTGARVNDARWLIRGENTTVELRGRTQLLSQLFFSKNQH